jgi:ABC-type iron transport system FetAB ATPase subunit
MALLLFAGKTNTTEPGIFKKNFMYYVNTIHYLSNNIKDNLHPF